MSDNNEETSRLIRPDGLPSDAEVFTVKLHTMEVPLPSANPHDLAQMCMREVQTIHPISGVPITSVQMAMTADTALVLLETDLALKVRDETIAAQSACIETLETRLAELERRFDEPTEQAKREGFDGIG